MAAKARVAIPQRTKHQVLIRNQNACCVCQRGPVQIHHMDGDPSNNSISNLAVLCLEHHDLTSRKSSMSRGLPAPLLRSYKSQWEGVVSRKLRLYAPRRERRALEKRWAQFEVKKQVLTLPTLKQTSRFNAALDYLYYLDLDEDVLRYFLRQLEAARWFLSPMQIEVLSERLYEFFWQFIDPKEVPLRASDQRTLLTALRMIGSLGEECAILEFRVSATARVVRTLYEFYQIGISYKRSPVTAEARKQLAAIRKQWRDSTKAYGKRVPKALASLFARMGAKMSP